MSVLTDFPQASSQLLVLVEESCELVAVVQDTHKPQKLIRRDRIVDLLITKQIVRGLDQEQLKHTFDDNLLEHTTSIVEVGLGISRAPFGT